MPSMPGTSALGGAVALVGDDPTAKSSTVPSSSAGVLSDLHMPMLYPGDPAEVLDLGRHAVALSRVSGLWTALKIVSDVADGSASVELDIDRVQPVMPKLADGREYHRAPEGRLLTPRTLELEREIYEVRYELASAYASANRLNRVTADSADAWLGIVASGITYREVLEAFAASGLEERAGDRRVRRPPSQDADAAAVRSPYGARVRERPRRGFRDRGEAAQHRAAREGRALLGERAAGGDRQARRIGPPARARLRRARRRFDLAGLARAPRAAARRSTRAARGRSRRSKQAS